MFGYDFHRQKPLDNYIADFFCHELMLVIELDGFSHNLDEVVEKDIKKENRMKELGLHVLRFPDDLVLNDIENVLREIEAYILEYEKTHPRPQPAKKNRIRKRRRRGEDQWM